MSAVPPPLCNGTGQLVGATEKGCQQALHNGHSRHTQTCGSTALLLLLLRNGTAGAGRKRTLAMGGSRMPWRPDNHSLRLRQPNNAIARRPSIAAGTLSPRAACQVL